MRAAPTSQPHFFLKSQTTRKIWNTIQSLWILTYHVPPDFLAVDQLSCCISTEMKINITASAITLEAAPIEDPGSVFIVERYHDPLRSVFTKLREIGQEGVYRLGMLKYGRLCNKCNHGTRRYLSHAPCIRYIPSTGEKKPVTKPVGKTKSGRRNEAPGWTRTIQEANIIRIPPPNQLEIPRAVRKPKETFIRLTSTCFPFNKEKNGTDHSSKYCAKDIQWWLDRGRRMRIPGFTKNLVERPSANINTHAPFRVRRMPKMFGIWIIDELKQVENELKMKSRLLFHHCDDGDAAYLTKKVPTVQHCSQNISLSLVASLPEINLYARDITQAYT